MTSAPNPSENELASLVDQAWRDVADYGRRLDEWILREIEGDGTGRPMGILTSASKIYAQPKPITFDDLRETYEKLMRPRTVVCSPAVAETLRGRSDELHGIRVVGDEFLPPDTAYIFDTAYLYGEPNRD